MTLDALSGRTRDTPDQRTLPEPEIERPLAESPVPGRAPAATPRHRPSRIWAVWVEVGAACGTAALLAVVGGWATTAALASLALWVAVVHRGPHGALGTLQTHLVRPVEGLVVVMAVAGTLSAVGRIAPVDLGGVLLCTGMATAASVLGRLGQRRYGSTRALLVGQQVRLERLEELVSCTRSVSVAGVYVVPTQAEEGNRLSAHELLTELRDAVAEHDADAVVATTGGLLDGDQLRQLSWSLEEDGVELVLAHPADTVSAHRLRPVTLAGRTMLAIRPTARPLWQRATKAMVDRCVAAGLLFLIAPVLLLLCFLVRLESPGPAIFKQRRVGRRGATFTMYKVRTMALDAEALRVPLQRTEPDKMLFKLVEDPRITPLGRVLRRFSLDELPQLLNVMKGDMSLVGPRPALPEEVARYDGLARRRLALKPGLSGLWQVSGRSDLDWEHSLALDLHYVDNGRLRDDLMILARTVRAVLGCKGAY